MLKDNFNLIIVGVGGQGLITLLSIINEAAIIERNDVRSSELHGLSQRGGSVETHTKFGYKVYSPLVYNGQADLILGLDVLEAMRALNRAGEQTKFLVNDYYSPFQNSLPKEEIIKALQENLGERLFVVPASEICVKELQSEVVSGVYLLGYATKHNLIPLKFESVMAAVEKVIPQKYLELNKKALNLAK